MPKSAHLHPQNLGSKGYEEKKEQVVNSIIERLQPYFPGLKDGIVFRSPLDNCLQPLHAYFSVAWWLLGWVCFPRLLRARELNSKGSVHCKHRLTKLWQGSGHAAHTQALPGPR
jgi:hypothetical protein